MTRPDPTRAPAAVAVVGAAGLIGRAVTRRLRRAGHPVLAVDRRFTAPLDAEERLVADLGAPTEATSVVDAFAHRGVRAVVYLVSHYDFRNTPDPRYAAVEAGLQAFLGRMKTLGLTAPVLYSSSMASLAPTEPGCRLTEDSPRSGQWAYPAHKLRCEAILEQPGFPFPVVELVLAGVYTDWCELVPLHRHIERVRTGWATRNFYPGPTDRGLTYVHEDDVGEAFLRAVERAPETPGVLRFLIGEQEPVTYRTIQQTASRVFFGRPSRLVRVPRPLARLGARLLSKTGLEPFVRPWMVAFSGEHFEFDLSRAHRALGWTPSHHLSQELSDMCRRALEAPETWRRKNEARPY